MKWARDLFGGFFKNQAEDVNNYLDQPDYLKKLKANANMSVLLTTLEGITAYLEKAGTMTIKDCVVWARMRFEDLFHHNIAQLIYNFPEDHISASGVRSLVVLFFFPPFNWKLTRLFRYAFGPDLNDSLEHCNSQKKTNFIWNS